RFADVATFDVDYESKSVNFNPVIQRGRTNTFTETQTFNIINKYFLNKLFPNSWNLDIPVTLRRNYTLGKPRFKANSDLLVANIPDQTERDRQKSETLAYYADFGYSQRTPSKNKFLEYTLSKITLSGNVESRFSTSSTAADTTFSWRGTMGYNLNFPADKVSFKLFKNYRLGYVPTVFTNSFTLSSTDPKSWNWELRDGVYGWHERAQVVDTKLFTSDNSITWPLTSDLSASARFNSKRDLLQKDYVEDLNIGKRTEYVQDLGLNFNPRYFPRLMNLSSTASARYTDIMRKYYADAGQTEVFQSDGNSRREMRTNVTLLNSDLLSALAQKLKARSTQSQPSDPKDSFGDDKKPKDEYLDSDEGLSDEELKKMKEEELEKYKQEEQMKEEEKKESSPDSEGESDPKKQDSKDEDNTGMDEFKDEIEYKDDEFIPEGDSPKKERKPGVDPLGLLVSYLARVKNITASYQNGYTQSFSRKNDLPSFLFQLGAPHSMPKDYLDAVDNDNTITLSSGIFLGRNLDSTINFSHTINRRYSNASLQNVSTTFPDFTLSFMNWERWLGISKYVSGARINTGFQYTVRANGDIDWDKPKQETQTLSLSPLIGFSGNILNKVTTNLSFTMTQSTNTTDMDTYDIVKTNNSHSLNGNVSYSFTAGRGFTIPFTQKKIHIKNQLSSSLGVNYENNLDKTKGRESSQIDRSTSRLSLTPGATYQFDQNIRGGLTSSFEITSDRKRDDGTSIFSLGIWVEVNL
ncbi:MAG TPA: hypothetical protein PKI59_01585, partial [Candidatus Cloacimonadota bacterium]|nr:hypothetical protein [Candidatus Cloacimonadota bacterium]